jgi:hypothetical protein
MFDQAFVQSGVHAAVMIEEANAIIEDLAIDGWEHDPRFEQIKYKLDAIGKDIIDMTRHHLHARGQAAGE